MPPRVLASGPKPCGGNSIQCTSVPKYVIYIFRKTQLPFPKMCFSSLSNLCSISLFFQSSRIIIIEEYIEKSIKCTAYMYNNHRNKNL